MRSSEYISALWTLPLDLASRARSEAGQSRYGTFAALRRLCSWSRGGSRLVLRAWFRKIRPANPTLNAFESAVVNELRTDGITVVRDYFPPGECAEVLKFLETCKPAANSPVRADYRPEELLESAVIRSLITDPFLHNVAASYLGCTPIFTQVAAWRSLPDSEATAADLSEAAQLFHYDYDWPAFLKFFIYLTNVGPENGPFTFVRGTHERKRSWRHGRRGDAYIVEAYPNSIWPVTGKAGDLIAADTIGFHKGERVQVGERIILQIEFAVSRIGASCQYDPLPARHRPDGSVTFDAFSAP